MANEEELRVKITVAGGDKAKAAIDGVSKSTTTAGQAFTKLIPHGTQVTSTIESLTKKMGDLAPSMGVSSETVGMLSTGLSAAVPAIAAVTVAVGSVTLAFKSLQSIAQLMVETAPLEGIANSFYGMADAAGVMGDEVLKGMQEASGGTIEATKLMTNFNLASQLVSPNFALRLTDAMGPLQKVAAATGQSMDYMLESIVRGIGRESPMILDNLGITIDITKAYGDYAAAVGVSVEELSKAERQSILINQVMRQLKANTADMPDVTYNAAASISAIKATFANLRQELGLALMPAFGEVMYIFKQVAVTAAKQLEPAMITLRQAVKTLQTQMREPETKKAIDELIKAMATLFSEAASGAINMMSNAVQNLARNWRTQGPAMIKDITALIDKLVYLAETFNTITMAAGIFNERMSRAPSQPIRGYASGVTNAPGGWSMVGERGPEVMYVPKGASIYPNGQAPGGMGGVKIYGPISITAPNDGSLSALMQSLEAAATATA
jgi:hypothetical protein